MKKCPSCKNSIADGENYCTRCGEPAPKSSSFGGILAGIVKGLAYVALFSAVQYAVAFLYSFAVSAYYMATTDIADREELYQAVYKSVLINNSYISIAVYALTLLIIFVYFKIRKRNLKESVGMRKAPAPSLCYALVAGVFLNYLVTFLTAVIPVPEKLLEKHDEMYSYLGEGNLFVEFLAVAILAPVIEEILFRGLLYSHARRVMPAAPAIILAAAVFGLAHGNILSFVYTGALGAFLALSYEKSGSIVPSIFIHIGFNSGSYLISLTPIYETPVYFFGVLFISGLLSLLMCSLLFKSFSVSGKASEYMSESLKSSDI